MPKSNIYIYTYNNYFNRIIKKESSLAGYGTPTHTLTDTNFNYNDGVSTSHDFNYNGEGDYLIVTDAENNIKHRWFIIENKNIRGNQYRFTLRRDLITDFYDIVVVAPMIVSRAMISNPNSALLFNPEGFSFNQIKKREYTLYDDSHAAWYYLYFNKSMAEKQITVNLSDTAYDASITGNIDAFFPTPGIQQTNVTVDYMKFKALTDYGYYDTKVDWKCYSSSSVSSSTQGTDSTWYHRIFLLDTYPEVRDTVDNMLKNNYLSLTTTYLSEITNNMTLADYNKWKAYDGKKVLATGDNHIYQVIVDYNETTNAQYVENLPNTWDKYKTMIDNSGLRYSGGYGTEALEMNTVVRTLTVYYEDITSQTQSISFKLFDNNANYVATQDSEFKVIAIPYDIVQFYDDSNASWVAQSDVSQKIVKQIMLDCTDQELVDVQLLPYCPYQSAIVNWSIKPNGNISNKQYQWLTHTSGSTTLYDDFIFYIDKSNFTFDLNWACIIGNYDSNQALNKKIANEVELWRLVSPNYNGQFEFSAAKNDNVNGFNVDMTLKPYNPYIHINPKFKSLYGQDWDDARGLICNGDFSLPRETSAWTDYELRNKNYQIAFNRQIEHMDFQQSQERVGAIASLATGTLGAGTSGLMTGMMMSGMNPVAGGVGAAVGAAASFAGGMADLAMMSSRQREDKDYTIDNYRYQLGNIKALPNSISKVTPLTYNNKKFPFIEMYSCTDEEINILKNKIHYNSMTVNAIGSIQEYLQPEKTFISGTLIRLEDSGLPNNELYEIYDELKKGVYI